MLLKREDCKRTRHDSAFSQWKVLIGPSDWEDHSLGKEGAERYRVHNLPNCSSCSGLYELGIVAPHAPAGRETRKLKSYSVIPVYLGQAENVRTRLQQYGREGAHLGNCKSTGGLNDSAQQGPGLFLEIFTRGCSVVYRWAPMKNKRDAVKTEAQLLGTFDYAWNKGSNGVRRPNDILQKLGRRTLQKTLFPVIARKLQTFHQKKMGIKIESFRSFLLEDGSSTYSDWENIGLLSRILKFGRSQPRLVSETYGCNEDNASICGVALGGGSVCRMLPIEGRRRCDEHKGMKVNGFTSMLIKEGKSLTTEDVTVESHVSTDPECESYQAPSIRYDKVKPQLVPNHCAVGKYTFSICGVTMHDGTSCRRQPVQGRKRCANHKGRKITGTIVESLAETNHNCLHSPHFGSDTCADGYELVSQEHGKCEGLQTPAFLERSVTHELDNTTCGVNLTDGTFCRRRPVVGRKRCKEHKGLRVTGSKPKLPVENVLGLFEGSGICSPVRGVLDGSFIDSSGLWEDDNISC